MVLQCTGYVSKPFLSEVCDRSEHVLVSKWET